MSKRTLMMVVALVAALAVAATGTLAYLTDTDSDVNVMTLGNVDIEQHELQRTEAFKENAGHKGLLAEGDLEPFVDGKPIYPAFPANNLSSDYTVEHDQPNLLYWGPYVTAESTGNGYAADDTIGAADGLWDETKLAGAVDKFVFVENTGTSPVYYRTLIAFECPVGVEYSLSSDKQMMINESGNSRFQSETVGYITLEDGTRYMVNNYTYTNELAPGEISCPSLLQVVMTHNATNETVQAMGATYDVLALSQAVQVENLEKAGSAAKALDTAFGVPTEANLLQWFSKLEGLPVATVANAEELAAALAQGGTVVLTDDVTVTSTLNVAKGEDVVLNLNGNDISYAVDNNKAAAIINNAGTMKIAGEGTISFVASNPDLGEIPSYATNTISNTGTLTIGKGVTVTNGSEGGASYAVDNHGVFTLDGGTLIGDRCALRIAKFNQKNVVFVMNSGRVEAKTPAWIHLPGSDAATAPNISVTINGGTLQSTKDTSADNDVLYTYSFGNSHANTSLTINGGEFLGGTVSIGSGYKGDIPELTINGGTFEYDVMQWLENDESTVLYAANK